MNELWYRIQTEAARVKVAVTDNYFCTNELRAQSLLVSALKLREQADEVEKEAQKIHPQTVEQNRKESVLTQVTRDQAWALARDSFDRFEEVYQTSDNQFVRAMCRLIQGELAYRSVSTKAEIES